jgi:hypothetical protein
MRVQSCIAVFPIPDNCRRARRSPRADSPDTIALFADTCFEWLGGQPEQLTLDLERVNGKTTFIAGVISDVGDQFCATFNLWSTHGEHRGLLGGTFTFHRRRCTPHPASRARRMAAQ